MYIPLISVHHPHQFPYPLSVSVPRFGYPSCFKPDLYAVKSKVNRLNQKTETRFCVHSPPQCQSPPQCLFPLLDSYLRCFILNLYALKSKVDIPNQMIKNTPSQVSVPPSLQCLFPLLAISSVSGWIRML